MSGGSYDYKYMDLRDYYENSMYDDELNDLIKDLVEVLHDLEWWQSCDICEEDYRETVKRFKNKWFIQSRDERLKKYINKKIEDVKKELLELLGEETSSI